MSKLVKFVSIETRWIEMGDHELDLLKDPETDVFGEYDNVWSDLNGYSENWIEDEDGKVLWEQGY